MSTEKSCPNCGKGVVVGAAHCPHCGADIASLWVDTGGVPKVGSSGQLAANPGTPLVQQGGSARPWPFSADLLAERLAVGGYVQKPVVDALKAEATAAGRSLVDLILEKRQMSSVALRDAMSRIFGLPVADLATVKIDPVLITKAPSELARNHLLLPLHREGDRLVVVVADPTQAEVIRTVRRLAGLTVDLRLAAKEDLAPMVHQYFSPRLVVLLPSGQTMDLVLQGGELKIGRAEHNDVVLPDPTVGSSHAILRAHGSDYSIVDFGSRNGVFVDGKRINQTQQLRNGDVIKIGQCLLTFKLPIPDAAQGHDGATQILTPESTSAAVAAALKNVVASPAAAQAAAGAGAGFVSAGAEEDDEEKRRKKEKKKAEKEKKEKEKTKENEKLKSAWIGFVGRIVAQVVGAIATIVLGLMIAGKMPGCSSTEGNSGTNPEPPPGVAFVGFNSFGDVNPAGEVYNASAIVEIAPGRFLIADNNTNDALFELGLDPNGTKSTPLVRRPLVGVQAGQLDDMEGLAATQKDGRTIVFATTSMMNRTSKKKGEFTAPPSALLRIMVEPDGTLRTDVLPDIRTWFAQNVKEIGNSVALEPDDGGLNIEGLGFDPTTNTLMFGVRTPVPNKGQPVVIPVKIADLNGPWDASNLSVQPAIPLAIESARDEQGIRDLSYDPVRKAFFVVIGNSTSLSKAPFTVYQWDGATSAVRKLSNVFFAKGAKPEGVTHATLNGRGAVIFVDDNGGFTVLWDDDTRLQ